MAFKRIVTAATATALIFSPTVAVAARSASPSAGAQQVAPAAETVDEASELRRQGIFIPLVGILLIILIVLFLTKKKKKVPVSA